MSLPELIQREIARIVDSEWSGVEPSPCSKALPDLVTYVNHVRPLGESAPYWKVWVEGKPWGVRPRSELDIAWLRVAVSFG